VRRRLITLPAAALLAAGCTSFADDAGPAGTSSSATATTGPTATSAAGGLEVRDRTDLGTAASGVTAARLAADGDDRAVLLVGSPTSTVVTADSATAVRDAVPTDVVLLDGDPVAVALTTDPVAADPVLALVPVAGSTAGPLELDPQTTAPRGIPVLAAAGDGEVLLLVEDTDRTGARVLAVDPATGEVREDVDLDLGEDVVSVDLLGLAATDDGVVAGVGVRGADGTTTGRLVALDADLQPDGDPQDTDGELLALTVDGTPVTADEDGTVQVDGDQVAADLGTRVSGAALVDGTPVVAFLDQGSPTVVVGDEPVQLCDGDGDALAVAATGGGEVLVAGTCDGNAVLWTLG